MHKKLEADLISLAHSILQMKNKENVFLLKQKSKEIYEKLSVLAFVEEYVNATPNLKETKKELIAKVEKSIEDKYLISEEQHETIEEVVAANEFQNEYLEVENDKLEAEVGEGFLEEISTFDEDLEEVNEFLEVEKDEEIEQPFDDIEDLIFGESEETTFNKELKVETATNGLTLEEELEDTIPVDVIANLFETVKPASLNNKLQTNIQIGLNDRIAFVKHLFENSQEDFNRVISQLNTFKTEKEAKKFIIKMVKPDYNWSEQEELENRLLAIIERRFS